MNSIGAECTDLKRQYDECFNSWFSEQFLKGKTDDSACANIFKHYQNAMKEQNIEFKDIEKDILGSDEECKIPPKMEKPS
ncbi:uncharacterized protein LOC143912735 isoform X2 [Arctopsyche grandis]|uniref:uncharacterized protein LOC143912735 isoform X2 n=1 Tax=Arctopsyche grandis TaxID=121162 RepID=UPI00406D79CA